MIRAININKKIKEVSILKEIYLTINQGDYTAIMGASGSGKSSLLYALSGMDTITSGKILFEKTEISSMREEELALFRLKTMGFVFQNAQMLKNLSIIDNIMLPGLVAGTQKPAKIREKALKLMEQMGIDGLENRDIREVSGGQLQRASICRAMINAPQVLFMDEPTGALNSEATDQVLALIHRLNQGGMTIVMVTHDQRVADQAKTILHMCDGELV